MRFIRVFVNSEGVAIQRMKKVGMLLDKYLDEISPDHHQGFKVSWSCKEFGKQQQP